MSKTKRKGRSKLAFPLGLIIIIFAIVGMVLSVFKGIDFVKKLFDDSDEKAAYQKMLTPIVMYDPDLFDDITTADIDQLTACAVWAIIKDTDNYDGKYQTDDQGRVVIPVEDVNDKFKELFGSDVVPTHVGVTSFDEEFTYNEPGQCYLVNSVGSVPIYTPKITDIKKNSNTITLNVAYLAAEGWAQDSAGNFIEPEPTKYVTVILRNSNDNNYYISAITTADINEGLPTAAVAVNNQTTSSQAIVNNEDESFTSEAESFSLDESSSAEQ